jgi:integrase
VLYKHPKSPYWYFTFTIQGIRFQGSTKQTSKAAAKRYEDQKKLEAMLEIGERVIPRHTWLEVKQEWMKAKKDNKSYSRDLLRLKFIDKSINDSCYIDEITREKIEEIAELKEIQGVCGSTVNRILALIKSILRLAKEELEWIEKIPKIRFRKESAPRTRFITKEEFWVLLKELPTHLNLLARFAVATGQRARNVRLVKWLDIDIERKVWLIAPETNKNNKIHCVRLNSAALDVLKEAKEKISTIDTLNYVFLYEGRPVTKCSTNAWKKAKERAGIQNFRWHDLRHTTASYLAMAGVSLKEIGEYIGHQSVSSTNRYAHLTQEHLQKVSEKIAF